MAHGWIKAIKETPGLAERVDIVGLVDLDSATAEELAAKHGLTGVRIATDLASLLGEIKPDVLLDVVVPGARPQVVRIGLEHGCHVLSEKPMAPSMDEARALIDLAQRQGKIHAIVQNRRYNEGVRRIRATLENGVLGTLNAIHCDFFVGAHFGGFREQMDHVLLLDMAIHTLDAARFMSGKQPLAVYCQETNPQSSWYAHGSTANAIFEFSDAVTFTYRGSWSAEGANTSWDSEWRIVGSKGTLLWDGAEAISAKIVSGNEGFFRPIEAIEPAPADPDQTHGHASVLIDFFQAIANGTQPESTGSDNIKSLAMVFAAIESAKTRQRVEIEL
jgi:predicted dehydrogenase